MALAFFVALPVLSSRSGLLFLRTRRWLALLLDSSAMWWAPHPHARDFVVQQADAVFLLRGYASMLALLVLAAALDEATRQAGVLYVACRRRADARRQRRRQQQLQLQQQQQQQQQQGGGSGGGTRNGTGAGDEGGAPAPLMPIERLLLPQHLRVAIVDR